MPDITADFPTSDADTLPLSEVLPDIERADVEGAALLRAYSGRVVAAGLPFYAGAVLLRAEAWLPSHPVVRRYVRLERDRRALPLGSPDAVLAANVAADLRLTAQDAVAYLAYYLESSGGGVTRRIVERPSDVRFLPDSDAWPGASDARAQTQARVHAAGVQATLAGGFRVTATTLRGYALEAVTFDLKRDGRVAVERATTLVAEAPVVWAY